MSWPFRRPAPAPQARSIWRIVVGTDGQRYRLDEPADLDRLAFALSDEGERSPVAQAWRDHHCLTETTGGSQ